MAQALYRKYRPKSLDELVGQEHVSTTLKNALQSGKINHAYLFTGPRGVGKTSVARILAHEVNKLAYDDDTSHIDIIEIDAASNNGVEHVRDLREKAYVAPAETEYKVYIIDEVHMLSKPAFNALLKILEEPPAHVIFILATTELHKLPETIVSRTQRHAFKPVSAELVINHLKNIAKQEKIAITDDALKAIAMHGEGSFRDSIGLLEQTAGAGSKIDVAQVDALLGLPPQKVIDELTANLISPEVNVGPDQLINQLTSLTEQGYQANAVAKRLAENLRNQLVNSKVNDPPEVLRLLAKLIEVPASRDPERLLEIICLEAVLTAGKNGQQPAKASQPTEKIEDVKKPEFKDNTKPEVSKTEPKPKTKNDKALNDETWQEVLTALKGRHNSLYSVSRMAKPEFSGDEIKLTVKFPFHERRLNDAKNQALLAEIIEEVTGRPARLSASYDANLAVNIPPVSELTLPTETEIEPATSADLAKISDIFGGGELI